MSVELVLFDYLNDMKKAGRTTILNLGGASGPSGGVGGGVIGYTGRLPQTRITYDETELESDYTPVSGESLLNNLNHIRYRINALEDMQITHSGFYSITVSTTAPSSPNLNDLWVDIS